MCIFAGERRVHASKTNIFARIVETGRQALAYGMTIDASAETAMVLPLPVASETGEDAVRFVALDRHPGMFVEIAALFPSLELLGRGRSVGPPALERLAVHEVGSFAASYVPTRADFGRLDPRFRIPDAVFDGAPHYADYGFAVFQLQAGARSIHPMAFIFPTRDPDRLYFPTVHVHDGRFHERAEFDHALYYQHPRCTEPGTRFGTDEVSTNRAARYEGLTAFGELVVRRTLRGTRPNVDTWIAAT